MKSPADGDHFLDALDVLVVGDPVAVGVGRAAEVVFVDRSVAVVVGVVEDRRRGIDRGVLILTVG